MRPLFDRRPSPQPGSHRPSSRHWSTAEAATIPGTKNERRVTTRADASETAHLALNSDTALTQADPGVRTGHTGRHYVACHQQDGVMGLAAPRARSYVTADR